MGYFIIDFDVGGGIVVDDWIGRVGIARSESMCSFDLAIGYWLVGLLPDVVIGLELVLSNGWLGGIGLLVFTLFKEILIHVFIFQICFNSIFIFQRLYSLFLF